MAGEFVHALFLGEGSEGARLLKGHWVAVQRPVNGLWCLVTFGDEVSTIVEGVSIVMVVTQLAYLLPTV